MSLASIQTLAFISYCSPRMAGASTSVYEFDNVVRGQHIYKMHGLHSLTKNVYGKCILWEDNKRDEWAVNN